MTITKARIALNSAANVSSHFLRLFIGIFMTPFLLNRLGAEVYGIMPLVNSCIAFVVLAAFNKSKFSQRTLRTFGRLASSIAE